MLYPCNCPLEPDGGLARRASLVHLLRRKYTECLLVDSGGFFAGGPGDEYSQNAHFDQLRTQLQLRAMKLMGYDAVGIGIEEFNFGDDFLLQAASGAPMDFISSNLGGSGRAVKPFAVKSIAGLTVGIVGATPVSVKDKTASFSVEGPVLAVREAVAALREQSVDMIVLLSRLGETQDRKLLESVPGIDAVVISGERASEKPFEKVGDTFILRPSWQGRRLGVARFIFENDRLVDCQVEEVRLSPQLADDRDVRSFLPACFSDVDCRAQGLTAECVQAGQSAARCAVPEAGEVSVQVITSKECVTCHPEFVLMELKKHFPRLSVTSVGYPGAVADELMDRIKPQALPVYVFGQEIAKERNFRMLSDNFYKQGPYYVLKTEAGGVSYLFNRQRIPGRFDLFIRLYDERNRELLANVKALDPEPHFLIFSDENGLRAPGGPLELEDALRAVCIRKYAPEIFSEYIVCRSAQQASSWWQRCVSGVDTGAISACAQSDEGLNLLKENVALTDELKIIAAPTYLLDNQQIFSSEVVPQESDLREVIDTMKR